MSIAASISRSRCIYLLVSSVVALYEYRCLYLAFALPLRLLLLVLVHAVEVLYDLSCHVQASLLLVCNRNKIQDLQLHRC